MPIAINTPQFESDIYHYTSESGVKGILQKEKLVLQMTKADCLNDAAEGKEIFIHLKEVCEQLVKEGKLLQTQANKILDLGNNFEPELPTSYFYKNKEGLDAFTIKYRRCEMYVMSFCEEKDYLPMWNYYGAKESQGYHCILIVKNCKIH